MATLVSPGVSISVTDESFYAPAGTGTVPLIVIATAQGKSTPDGSGTAEFTTSANANLVKLITSQRDLLTNYGNPSFQTTASGTPIHGHELNEYGLLAAYSFLGAANRAYVLRADVDLAALLPSAVEPTVAPANGSYWVDTTETVWGLKRWNGSAWVRQSVKVPASTDLTTAKAPKAAYGKNGEFAVVYFTDSGTTDVRIKFYQKVSGAWYAINSSAWNSATSAADFQVATHLAIPTTKSGGGSLATGDLFLQTTEPNNGTTLKVKLYDSTTGLFTDEAISLYELSSEIYADLGTAVEGNLWAKVVENDTIPGLSIYLKRHSGGTSVTATSTTALSDNAITLTGHSGKYAFDISINDGTPVKVFFTTDSNSNGNASVDDMVADINSAISTANATLSFTTNALASNVSGKIRITNTDGYDILLNRGNVTGFTPANVNLTEDIAYTNFEALSYEASATQITGAIPANTVWADFTITATSVDLLEHNGSTWATISGDLQVTATEPTTQSDGSTALASGDIWVDSGDLENFPVIYKHDGDAWVLVDNTDQVTGDGIIFADFRESATSSLDADAPAATAYPAGILGWNKRASAGNIKHWKPNYTHEGVFIGPRWVDFSGNNIDGSPYMLRKAQRRVVVRAMQAAVASNEELRNETNRFNLIATPGYAELFDEMITLNVDRKETAFILVDPPFRLTADATTTQAWATNSNNATENGADGLVSSTPYAGVYYPHGLTTNLDGSSVMVPASHIALRTLAFNDQVAFPWFAPAGFQRGLVNNATSVGYLDPVSSEYTPVSLSEGQRDSLYINKINPIGNFPGRGLAVFGQKTLNPVASALDRVNVARLVVYLRERLDDIVKPFLFEPNDEVTRQNAKVTVDRFLGQLVTQRGLFDFLVVCDTTNNTPARIDRNELHIDIAIQPVKAVEFIYIPIRIQNTLGSTG